MSLSRVAMTDDQLAAAGNALKSFQGYLSPDSLNHATQVSLAAMVVYICTVFEMDPKTLCVTLRNNVDAIMKDTDLHRYVIDRVHEVVGQRRLIYLPPSPIARN